MKRYWNLKSAAGSLIVINETARVDARLSALGQHPRETLGFETPADRLRAVLQGPVETTPESGRSRISPLH